MASLAYSVMMCVIMVRILTLDGCACVITVQVHPEFQSPKFKVQCAGEAAKGNCAGYWGLD